MYFGDDNTFTHRPSAWFWYKYNLTIRPQNEMGHNLIYTFVKEGYLTFRFCNRPSYNYNFDRNFKIYISIGSWFLIFIIGLNNHINPSDVQWGNAYWLYPNYK